MHDNIPPGVYNIGAYKDGYYLETKRVTLTEVPLNLVFILTRNRLSTLIANASRSSNWRRAIGIRMIVC